MEAMTVSARDGRLCIEGSLDIDTAPHLRLSLIDALEHSDEVTLDLSEVSLCDASGVQVLLACRRQATSEGKHVRLSGTATSLTNALDALGLVISFDN